LPIRPLRDPYDGGRPEAPRSRPKGVPIVDQRIPPASPPARTKRGGSSNGRAPRTSGSIIGGAGILIAGRYGVAVLGWITTVIIVRTLTPSQFGQYSVVFSVLGIIGIVSELRLSRVVLQRVMHGEDDPNEVVSSYTTLRLLIGFIAYLAAMGVAWIGNYPSQVVQATAVGGLVIIILSGAYGLILLFEARLWLGSVAAANFWAQFVQLAFTAIVAAVGIGSVVVFAWASVVNGIVTGLVLLWALRNVARVRLRVDGRWWLEWLKEGAPLAIGAALDTIYFRIDILMLSLLDTFRAVAVYGVGYKFSDLLGAVPVALVTPAMTLMVRAWPNDMKEFRNTFRHTLILLTVGSIGAAVGFGVFAEPLIVHLYGDRYGVGADAARLLVAGQALHFFTALAFVTLVSVGRNRLYPIATLTGVALNVGLNLVLIPKFSFNGSGWATVITETAVMAVLLSGVARIPGLRPFPWLAMGKCVLAGALMFGAGELMLGRVLWPVAGALSGLLYLAALHFLQVDGPGGLRVLLRKISTGDLGSQGRGDVGELPAEADAAVDDLATIGLSAVPDESTEAGRSDNRVTPQGDGDPPRRPRRRGRPDTGPTDGHD
jgi:O-antigen/teichoic acid export membrane protein